MHRDGTGIKKTELAKTVSERKRPGEFMDALLCGQKLLPSKGVEVQRRNWNKRDGTGIKETELE